MHTPAISIRRARATDLPALRVLFQQLDDVHAVAEPEVVPTHDQAPRADADLGRTITNDVVFVAIRSDGNGEGEAVVGFAHVKVIDLGESFMFPKVPEVENLSVLEGVRGQGVGKLLMRACEDWACEAGYLELWVTAWSFNEPAAGLYRGEGFVPLSTRFRKRVLPRSR